MGKTLSGKLVSTQMKLAIPTLCRYDLLSLLLKSAEAGSEKPDEYLIIDNGGDLRSSGIHLPANTRVLHSGKNLGVARSWNIFLDQAMETDEPIVIANDDIIFSTHTFRDMIAATDQFMFVNGEGWSLFAQNPECTRRIGYYDEHFWPAYYEDSDYEVRLLRAGFTTRQKVLTETLFHEGWATTKQLENPEWLRVGRERCRHYFLRKWNGRMIGEDPIETFLDPWNGQPPWGHSLRSTSTEPIFRYDILNAIAKRIGANRYLEIGVSDGENIKRIEVSERWGVDPVPTPGAIAGATAFVPTTSFEFIQTRPDPFDLIFIDGDHHADVVAIEVAKLPISPGGVIVCHDSSPSTEGMQALNYGGGEWTGQVWRAIVSLRERGFQISTIDTDYGVAIVTKRPEADVAKALPDLGWSDLCLRRTELIGLVDPFALEAWLDENVAAPIPIDNGGKTSEVNTNRICLVMIVKNESAIIERCLHGALPFIDTWVIADTGSTDDTVERIERYFDTEGKLGKIVRFPFKNFAQARNDALAAARGVPGWDYALLLDADMLIDGELDDDALHGPAYRILQREGSLEYWNTRLLRRDAPANYVGVTHEFLSVEGVENLAGLFVIDRADGGSKGDKGERDIRLLSEDLAEHPLNERSMFYLAQTYRGVGRHHEAILWYRRRIERGGWDEEVWSSYYGIACAYRDLGDEVNVVKASLDAYNFRPTRGEPLKLLSQFYRVRGKNEAACAIAETLFPIDYPVGDALFVERDVYEVGADQELSIAGYWSKIPGRRAVGYRACVRLTTCRYAGVRDEAHKNFTHYARSAKDLFGADIRQVDWRPDDGYAPMNPSVYIDKNGRRLLLVRTVNYTVTREGQYPTVDGGAVIRTRNHLLEMDAEWNPIRSSLMGDVSAAPRSAYPVEGFEDCRLWQWDDRYLVSTTVRDLADNVDGRCEMAIASFNGNWNVHGVRPIRDYQHDLAQKNWMPIVGRPAQFVYSCGPTVVVDCSTGGTTEVARHDPPAYLGDLRGGSQLVEHDGGWICLTHEVTWRPERVYLHRFVRFDQDFRIVAMSDPFFFSTVGIEFCAGLARDGEKLVASFGVNDASAHLALFESTIVSRLLRPIG
jgi:glycosyltransferase involved in cell wall biosynthesis